jgi:hypothetical protein
VKRKDASLAMGGSRFCGWMRDVTSVVSARALMTMVNGIRLPWDGTPTSWASSTLASRVQLPAPPFWATSATVGKTSVAGWPGPGAVEVFVGVAGGAAPAVYRLSVSVGPLGVASAGMSVMST